MTDPTGTTVRLIEIAPGDVAYLHYTLEAYPNLCTLSSIDTADSLMRVEVPVGLADEFAEVLATISREVPLRCRPER